MAGEVKHKSVGAILSQTDYEAAQAHELDGQPLEDVIVVSEPPTGKCRILNAYWDPDTQKAVFEYDDEPIP